MPVGTSNKTWPSMKKPLAKKAWALLSPADSRNRVLIPQISDVAKVLNSVRARKIFWMVCQRGLTKSHYNTGMKQKQKLKNYSQLNNIVPTITKKNSSKNPVIYITILIASAGFFLIQNSRMG